MEDHKKRLAQELLDHKAELDKSLAERLAEVNAQNASALAAKQAELAEALESHKSLLAGQLATATDAAKFEYEKSLILRRSDAEIARDRFKLAAESDKEFTARMQAQFRRWALPVKAATEGLRDQLEYIVVGNGYKWLATGSKPIPGVE